jgi:hypothetical protein
MSLVFSDGDIPNAGLSADWQGVVTPPDIGFLEEHLVLNSFNGGADYPVTGGNAWRGAYLNAPVDPDPWGNRYGVNAEWLGAPGPNDTVVYSAGPDEAVDTQDTGNGLTPVNDDIIVLVEN